jgi:2-keto-4-pentenoate hydratase
VHADRQREAADLLLAAYATGRAMPPVIETFGEARIEDAYEIQRFTVLEWQRRGLVIKGHKVGPASGAMQRQVGVNQPDYGHLTSDMFHLEHLPIPAGAFIQPRRSSTPGSRPGGSRSSTPSRTTPPPAA